MPLSLPESTNPALAQRVEQSFFRTWPALREIKLDGWLLRFSNGYTDRANSVQPLVAGEMPLATKFIWCAGAYRDAGLPTQFRTTSLTEDQADLEGQLSYYGFKGHSLTRVMYLETIPDVPLPDGSQFRAMELHDWLAHFRSMNGLDMKHYEPQQALLEKTPSPNQRACLEVEGRIAACGQVVVDDGMAGIYDIVTDPEQRRQGHGLALTTGLLGWAKEQGATSAYLQVEADNDAAVSLYQKLGFTHLYDYQYWLSS